MAAPSHAWLHTLATRISGLDVRAHAEVMQYLEATDAAFTRNSNGVFVDLCSLEPSIIEGLAEILERHEQAAADTPAAEEEEPPQPQCVPWAGAVESKTVVERADEVIRKHLIGRPLLDTATRRRPAVPRRVFVSSQRRNDIYDACLNTLAADRSI